MFGVTTWHATWVFVKLGVPSTENISFPFIAMVSGTLHRHTQSWDVVWLLRGACWLVRALRAALHESHESAPRCAALLADTGQQHSTTQGA